MKSFTPASALTCDGKILWPGAHSSSVSAILTMSSLEQRIPVPLPFADMSGYGVRSGGKIQKFIPRKTIKTL